MNYNRPVWYKNTLLVVLSYKSKQVRGLLSILRIVTCSRLKETDHILTSPSLEPVISVSPKVTTAVTADLCILTEIE